MKYGIKTIRPYIPWLLLLFGIDAFATLLLWIANVQAFHAFLYSPDEYHEELLLEIVSVAERDSIRLLGKILRQESEAILFGFPNGWHLYVEYKG